MVSPILFSVLFSLASSAQLVTFWGHGKPGVEKSLSHYCRTSDADIIVISNSRVKNIPDIELGPHCQKGGSEDCVDIGLEIITCQHLKKTILLSVSKDVSSDAQLNAEKLLKSFGRGGDGAVRPFGIARVNGFFMDLPTSTKSEDVLNKMIDLAKELKNQEPNIKVGLGLGCVMIESPMERIKNTFDLILVKFFEKLANCAIERNFGWPQWKAFAGKSGFSGKFLVGILASGLEQTWTQKSVIPKYLADAYSSLQNDPLFGGFGIWDATSAEMNDNFISKIRGLMEGAQKVDLAQLLIKYTSGNGDLSKLRGKSSFEIATYLRPKLLKMYASKVYKMTWPELTTFAFHLFKSWSTVDVSKFDTSKSEVELSKDQLSELSGLTILELNRASASNLENLAREFSAALKRLAGF